MNALPDDHIRLISLHVGSETNDLETSRKHIYRLPSVQHTAKSVTTGVLDYSDDNRQQASGTAPSYIALSYFWGSQFQDVSCDGVNVKVSSNLAAALVRLHQHFPEQLIWTDSLSINQHDLKEKSHQVSIMGRIFSKATTVAIWLGDEANGLGCELRKLVQETRLDEATSKRRVNLLRSLSQIPWFYRVWTFQELRLAETAVVIIDDDIMSWSSFIQNIQDIRNLEPQLSTIQIRSQPQSYSRFHYSPQDRFFAILNELHRGTSRDLAGLLFVTWYRDATEKCDKVYSLLSGELLANVDHGISVDYEIPWSELCVKAARASINTSQNLKILKIAGMTRRWRSPLTGRWDSHELQQLYGHPSWAPDWWNPPQQTRSHSSLLFDRRGVFRSFDYCCSVRPPRQNVENTSPFLELKGVLLGLINTTEKPTFPGGAILVHSLPFCATSARSVIMDPAKEGRGMAQVLMPILIADIDRHLNADCSCVSYQQRQKQAFPRPSFPSNQQTQLHFTNEYFTLHASSVSSATAESEHPAEVLAQSVESGDWLVLLEGGGQPLVLRPVKDTSGRIPSIHEFSSLSKSKQLPLDAGLFVLVGEASMCWDVLWPEHWDVHCRAGTFVLI